MTGNLIEIRDLVKRFGPKAAVDGLSFDVPKGSICGFLGRNGAGKTTTLKMLLGMMRPTSGGAAVFGLPVDRDEASVEIRRRTAFVSETRDFYPYMTVAETIRFVRYFYPAWDSQMESALLRQFELPLTQKTTKLSKGMKTQLAMLLALCRGAELLVLDEPTDGLDPVLVEDMLKLLVRISGEKSVTIFFSSHQLEEVERIADRVVIIDRGKVRVEGALEDLRTNYRRVRLVFRESAPAELVALGAPGDENGRTLSLLAKENVDQLVDRARYYHASDIDVQPVSLKEIFMETVRN